MKQRGVSLLELLFALLIVGIVLAIAVPNYRNYIAKAHRSEAKSVLLKIAIEQEKHFLQHSCFTTDLNALNATAQTGSGNYAITVVMENCAGFTASATLLDNNSAEARQCAQLQLSNDGIRRSAPADDCWTRTR